MQQAGDRRPVDAEKASVIVRGLTNEHLARTGAYVGDDVASVDWWVDTSSLATRRRACRHARRQREWSLGASD